MNATPSNEAYVIICTQGLMDLTAIRRECRDQSWCPILVYNKDGNRTIPYFKNIQTANSFRKRNFPKEWIGGVVDLTPIDIQTLSNKGLNWEYLDFPKKMPLIFEVEIHEFAEKPLLYVNP